MGIVVGIPGIAIVGGAGSRGVSMVGILIEVVGTFIFVIGIDLGAPIS